MQIRLKELFEIKTGKGVTSKDIVKGGKYPINSGGVTPMGYINEYNRNKYKNDPIFKLKLILRNTIKNQLKLKDGFKPDKTLNILGCPLEEFRNYIGKQFYPEMNWGNHGIVWEIDHIKECFRFDLSKEEEVRECFHYTNMRPLFSTTEIAQSLGYYDVVGNRNRNKR